MLGTNIKLMERLRYKIFLLAALQAILLLGNVDAAPPNCDCDTFSQNPIQNNPGGSVLLQNPGGANRLKACALDCSWRVGYNESLVPQVGVQVTITICTGITSASQLVLYDGTYNYPITPAICNQAAAGNSIIFLNQTRNPIITINLTETTAAIFVLQFASSPLLVPPVVVTPGPTPGPWFDSDTNPGYAHMDLVVVVDVAGTDTDTFYNRTKPVALGLIDYLQIYPGKDANFSRVSLMQASPSDSNGFSFSVPWQLVKTNYTKYANELSLTMINNGSYLANTLTRFIGISFDANNPSGARERTQKVFLVFTNKDINVDDYAAVPRLVTLLQAYDIHTVFVQMGDPLTNLINKLNGTGLTKGSNLFRVYPASQSRTSINDTIQDIFDQILMNGNYLCAMDDPANAIVQTAWAAGVAIPFPNQASSQVNPQAYCNNMNWKQDYVFSDPAKTIANVQVTRYELNPFIDYLDIYDGNNVLIASVSGLNATTTVCFNATNPVTGKTSLSLQFLTANHLIYRGFKVKITEQSDFATPPNNGCPDVNTYFKRK